MLNLKVQWAFLSNVYIATSMSMLTMVGSRVKLRLLHKDLLSDFLGNNRNTKGT